MSDQPKELIQLQLDADEALVVARTVVFAGALMAADIEQQLRQLPPLREAMEHLTPARFNNLQLRIAQLIDAGFSALGIKIEDSEGNLMLCSHCYCDDSRCCWCDQLKPPV